MGNLAPSRGESSLPRSVQRAVGVCAHAAAEGGGGQGQGVLDNAPHVASRAASARQDPVGVSVAGCTAGRRRAEVGDGRGALSDAVVGMLRVANGDEGWVWEIESWMNET